MEVTRHPYAGKKQKKIKEKELLREGFLRIRDGEKYKMREMLSLYTCLYYQITLSAIKNIEIYKNVFFRNSQ